MADAVAAQLRAVALPPSKSPAARKAVARALQRACVPVCCEALAPCVTRVGRVGLFVLFQDDHCYKFIMHRHADWLGRRLRCGRRRLLFFSQFCFVAKPRGGRSRVAESQ